MGAVLFQRDERNKCQVVAYFSRTFTSTEQKYATYNQELMAMVWALCTWRHFVAGSPFKTKVWCDHRPLEFWQEARPVNIRVRHYMWDLDKYNLEIYHIPGKDNTRADTLSRHPDYPPSSADDHVVVLPKALFVVVSHLSPECVHKSR